MAQDKDKRQKRIAQELKKLRKQEREEDKEKIARLEAAVGKSDEELQNSSIDADLMDYEEQQGADPAQEILGNSSQSATDPAQEGQTSNSSPLAPIETQEEATKETNHIAATSGTQVKSEPPPSPLFEPMSDENPDFDVGDGLDENQYGNSMKKKTMKTVGWIRVGGRTIFFNRYGRQKGPVYRTENAADTPEYEDNPPPEQNCRNNRLGEKNRPGDSSRRALGKHHVKRTLAIAWKGLDTGNFRDDLQLIKPDRFPKGRRPTIYILIEWEFLQMNDTTGLVETVLARSWETHSEMEKRYGKDSERKYFKAASKSQDRYEEVENERQSSASRSPSRSPSPDEEIEGLFRGKSLDSDRSSPSRGNPSLTPAPADLDAELRDFEQDYTECAKMGRFKSFDPQKQAVFLLVRQLNRVKL